MNKVFEEELALKAALGNPQEALLSWNKIMSEKRFDEIQNSTIRVLPAIYENVKNQKGVAEANRLRGTYKMAWINNTKFISTLIPILQELQTMSIDYRVLKGMALNLLFGSLGVRTMGDMDLIFLHKNTNEVIDILKRYGFKQVFSSACPHRSSSHLIVDSNWENADGIQIDLHIVEKSIAHGPTSFFKIMMQENPLEISISGTVAKLPNAELLLIHAVYHGDMRVARSDQIQSLIDCSRLIELIDFEKLNGYCKLENCGGLVRDYLNYVFSISGKEYNVNQITIPQRNHVKARAFSEKIIFHIARLPRVFFARHLPFSELFTLMRSKQQGGILYKAWTALFQLRFLEEIICRYFHGFLDDPKIIPLSLIIQERFFDLTNTMYLQTLSRPEISQEWRGKVEVPSKISRILVILMSRELAHKTFLVFINGRLLEVASFSKDGAFEFEVSQSGSIEISLRSPVRACINCRPHMDSLKMIIRKI